MTDPGTLGGIGSFGLDINSSGQIVGYFYTTGDSLHAFLDTGGIMTDLDSLLPPDSGWDLQVANAINDSAQIVGYGIIGGQTNAFLLDAGVSSSPEPTSLGLVSASAVFLLITSLRSYARPLRRY